MRQVYQDFLDALVQLHRMQERRDFESKLYKHLRTKVDELGDQLNKQESEDAYWFSLSLDRPGEGSDVPRGSVD